MPDPSIPDVPLVLLNAVIIQQVESTPPKMHPILAVAPGWYENAPAARHSNLIRNIVSGNASLFLIVMQIITGPDRFDGKTEARF
jgi:hypothetical protein